MLEWLSIPLSIFAYTLLSIGLVLQKKGIAWIGFKGKKDRTFYRALGTWFAGFLLMNLYIVPNTIALKHLPPHIVSAMAGWGVVVLVILSVWLLQESFAFSDFLFTVLIVSSIVILNLLERSSGQDLIRKIPLTAAAVFPFAISILALTRIVSQKNRAVLFAGVSGFSTGMIIIAMKILVMDHGFIIQDYFSSGYFYLYLVFSLTAFLTLQAAYKLGKMMAVGPVQYTASILYPVLCSAAVFGNPITLMQSFSVAVLVVSVAGLLWKRV